MVSLSNYVLDPLFMLSIFYFSRIHKHGDSSCPLLVVQPTKAEPEICGKEGLLMRQPSEETEEQISYSPS